MMTVKICNLETGPYPHNCLWQDSGGRSGQSMHYISDNTWPVLAVTQDNIQVRTSDYAFGGIKPEETTINRSGHRKNLLNCL
jgi:hypothetical protein